MPTIAKFYGIVIQMRLIEKEHNPPHIHAKYNDYEATFLISTGELEDGAFPVKAKQLVKVFLGILHLRGIRPYNVCRGGKQVACRALV